MSEREYKIWDNGNKCTIINQYEDYGGNVDFDYLIGDTPFGILSCNLRDYSLEYNYDHMKTAGDIFGWVMRAKKINKFNFDVNDIVKAFGDNTYIGYEGEDVVIDTEKEYSTEELRELILDMFDNDCFDDGMIYNIINNTSFDRFIICPFYAYIHSGIAISLGDFRDPWDSGMAGFTWYEFDEGETEVEAVRRFHDCFETYDDYIQGYYMEYHICTYEKKDGRWSLEDDFWDYQKSFEDAWECVDFNITDEVKNFSEEDKDLARSEVIVGDEEVLDYFEEYLA